MKRTFTVIFYNHKISTPRYDGYLINIDGQYIIPPTFIGATWPSNDPVPAIVVWANDREFEEHNHTLDHVLVDAISASILQHVHNVISEL